VAHAPAELVVPRPVLADEPRVMAPLFVAVVEAVEEAVLNALCAAETMTGRDGHTAHQLPVEQVAEIVRAISD
jgi:D-aminopeptidase